MKEKRQELEKKLQDVTGQLGGAVVPGPSKKGGGPKKGTYIFSKNSIISI